MNHRAHGVKPTHTERRAALKLTWSRKAATYDQPVRFMADKDGHTRIVVKKVEWKVPGFSGRTGTGWAVFINRAQVGPAYKTAIDAQEAAERGL